MQRQEGRRALFQEAFRGMPRWGEAAARFQKLGRDIGDELGNVSQETVMVRITRQRRREMAKILAKRSLA